MRIIKLGHRAPVQEITTTCPRCSTEFAFEIQEATYVADQRDGDAYKIKCPGCSHMCWVDTRVLRKDR